MKRIYRNYNKWEDYKNGMYSTPSPKCKKNNVLKIVSFFSNQLRVEKAMIKASIEWPYSMEHNLSNIMMNRVAYIGQAACCIDMGVDHISTMYAWKHVPLENRIKANKIAENVIKQWELKRISKDTLKNGKNKDMKMGYQMKLQLS